MRAHLERVQAQHREAVEAMQRSYEELMEAKLLADRDVERLRRREAALERALKEERQKDAPSATIRQLLEHFVEKHGKSDRFVIAKGSERWERVRRFLQFYKPQEIADAMVGVLHIDDGWWPRHLGRDLDVTHVLAVGKSGGIDAPRFEKFRQAGERLRMGLPAQTVKGPEPLRAVEPAPVLTPISKVLAALQPYGVQAGTEDRDGWAADCPRPVCNGRLIVQRGRTGRVAVDCLAGCDLDMVLEQLGLDLPDLWRGAEHDQDAADHVPPRGVVDPWLARELAAVGDRATDRAVTRLVDSTLNRWLPKAPRNQADRLGGRKAA
jgi:hypothetical protein